jgi:two-component system response regulator TctD
MERQVLIVDDEQEVLDVISEMIQALGYSPVGITDGNKALELLKIRKFDLVITDLIMPEIGGLEFVKKMRRREKQTPIIITAGVDLPETRVNLKKYGVNDFIRKPFFIDEVDTIIKKYLTEPQIACMA